MKFLSKSWKVILAILLLLIAIGLIFLKYIPEKDSYENQKASIENNISMLQVQIANNSKYEKYQEYIPGAVEEIDASRKYLYERFPKEMKEEDQIMYVIYLEQLFGTEISFTLSQAYPIQIFSDGAILQGLELTVNYETTDEGFKEMINYLATDSRITSIKDARIQYDPDRDLAIGDLTLICYILDSAGKEYVKPDVNEPEIGKDSIFG